MAVLCASFKRSGSAGASEVVVAVVLREVGPVSSAPRWSCRCCCCCCCWWAAFAARADKVFAALSCSEVSSVDAAGSPCPPFGPFLLVEGDPTDAV